MLGKLINGELVSPSDKEKEKIVITSPTDEMLKYIRGYKDVTDTELPEYDPETQYLETIYTETDTGITVTYEVKEMEVGEYSIQGEMMNNESTSGGES